MCLEKENNILASLVVHGSLGRLLLLLARWRTEKWVVEKRADGKVVVARKRRMQGSRVSS